MIKELPFMPYNFLIASGVSPGHLGPALAAAQQLRDRGHGVRFISREDARAAVEAAGYSFATWRRTPGFTPIARSSERESLRHAYDQMLFGPAAARGADTRDEINRAPTDLLLTDTIVYGAALGAEAAGIPCALLSLTISLRPLPGVPPYRSKLPSPRTSEQRAAINAASGAFAAELNEWLPMLNEARASLGLGPFDHMLDLFDRPARNLLAVSAAFDFPADAIPDNMRHIGPLLDSSEWAKPWTAPWPRGSGRPSALVSFSTTDQNQIDALQRTVNAIGRIEMDAVATTGPALEGAKLAAPNNVTLLPSAPHDAVMKEVSLVVTHGGHGTVSRALSRGLPLLVMPMGRDQHDIAMRVEFHGAGLVLPPTASETEIAAALSRLVREPHFREAAQRLSDAIASEISAGRFVHEMEEILQSR
jgi:MGT family glycosyltransferase